MEQWIERYVYDVTRRLPEDERVEVRNELKSSIYDMLPEDANERDLEKVLQELGTPASLAGKYRQNSRYLISPAIYDDYIRVLKWVVPLAAGVMFMIGLIIGLFEETQEGSSNLTIWIDIVLKQGVALGLSAAFQVLVWTTVGFIIADRVKTKTDQGKQAVWRMKDLPEVSTHSGRKIKLSDAISELVMTIVFSCLALFISLGKIPLILITGQGESWQATPFSDLFLKWCVPAIIVVALVGILASVYKLIILAWTPAVRNVVVVGSLIQAGLLIALTNYVPIFNSAFIDYVQTINIGDLNFSQIIGTENGSRIVTVTTIIIVIITVIECAKAIIKTRQPMK